MSSTLHTQLAQARHIKWSDGSPAGDIKGFADAFATVFGKTAVIANNAEYAPNLTAGYDNMTTTDEATDLTMRDLGDGKYTFVLWRYPTLADPLNDKTATLASPSGQNLFQSLIQARQHRKRQRA